MTGLDVRAAEDNLLPGQHVVRCDARDCPGHVGLDAKDLHLRCPTPEELIGFLRMALEPFARLCGDQPLWALPDEARVRVPIAAIAQARNVLEGITITDPLEEDRQPYVKEAAS